MPLISLDIRMLRSFVSVVQTGSITVTARQLGRTQPAITLQLQRLEYDLQRKTLLKYELLAHVFIDLQAQIMLKIGLKRH